MRMGSQERTACWMRATARSIPSMSMGSWRSSRVGLRKVSAVAASAIPREISRFAIATGQWRWSASRVTAVRSVAGSVHDCWGDCFSDCVGGGDCGPEGAEDMVRLLVALAVVDDDAIEPGDRLHEVLEAVVPVGSDLEEEHDALVGEAELQVADLADVVDEVFGVVDLFGDVAGEGFVAELVEEDDDVFLLKDDLAHGDERRSGGLC